MTDIIYEIDVIKGQLISYAGQRIDLHYYDSSYQMTEYTESQFMGIMSLVNMYHLT